MKQIISTTILFLIFFNNIFACLNGDSKELKNGTYLYYDKESNIPFGHKFNTINFKEITKQLDSLYNLTNDIDYISDKGLILILKQKYEEAVKLYLDIERRKPNRYSTASNIGTAYELLGQNENALKWIKKSVDIDSTAHKNSEWIHIKILEAKIKGERFYTTNFLLNVEFGIDIRPKSNMTKEQLQNLSDALYYQLNERISFVKPKEKIVAQLLFDYGNITFLLENYRDALTVYNLAKSYGYKGQLINQRIEEIKAIQNKKKQLNKNKQNKQRQTAILKYSIWILVGILFIITMVIIFKKKKE